MKVSAAYRWSACTSRRYGRFGRFFNGATALSLLALLYFAAPAAIAKPFVILAFGDSLTAGYGLPADDGFTRQLEDRLRAEGHQVEVRNGGVSGDTTAGGRSRLAWTLAERPDLVLLELGANDGLRGIDPGETRRNLDAILAELTARDIPVLLAGMRAPPNLGRDYTGAFDTLFADLAERYAIPLYPFFLDGVAARPELNQADGIHPNADGVAVIVERILPHVVAAMRQAQSTAPDS